jgi:hypothetical protein
MYRGFFQAAAIQKKSTIGFNGLEAEFRRKVALGGEPFGAAARYVLRARPTIW